MLKKFPELKDAEPPFIDPAGNPILTPDSVADRPLKLADALIPFIVRLPAGAETLPEHKIFPAFSVLTVAKAAQLIVDVWKDDVKSCWNVETDAGGYAAPLTVVRPVMTGIAAVVWTIREGVSTKFPAVRDNPEIPKALPILPVLLIPLQLTTPQFTLVETFTL